MIMTTKFYEKFEILLFFGIRAFSFFIREEKEPVTNKMFILMFVLMLMTIKKTASLFIDEN